MPRMSVKMYAQQDIGAKGSQSVVGNHRLYAFVGENVYFEFNPFEHKWGEG